MTLNDLLNKAKQFIGGAGNNARQFLNSPAPQSWQNANQFLNQVTEQTANFPKFTFADNYAQQHPVLGFQQYFFEDKIHPQMILCLS